MTAATLTRPTAFVPSADARAVHAVHAVQRPRTRVTRRGRLLLVALGALLLLAAVSVGRTGSQAATYVENGPTLQQTTVQPGDSLWTVAQRIAPANDPREVVAQIRRINHLSSSSLQAGQQLLLPRAG